MEGELEYGTYKNKEGVEVPSTKIIASVIDIIKGKEREEGISQHAQDKGNGFAPESNHVEEDDGESPPF